MPRGIHISPDNSISEQGRSQYCERSPSQLHPPKAQNNYKGPHLSPGLETSILFKPELEGAGKSLLHALPLARQSSNQQFPTHTHTCTWRERERETEKDRDRERERGRREKESDRERERETENHTDWYGSLSLSLSLSLSFSLLPILIG